MNIDKKFKMKHLRKTNRRFDYKNSEEINDDPEKNPENFILM
jgi:hypothetical protein